MLRTNKHKRFPIQILVATSIWFMAGLMACSSPYLRNRARDFSDIATLELQSESYGAGIHSGPFLLGAFYKSQDGTAFGLRGGQIGQYNSAGFTALAFGSDYFSTSKIDFDANWKQKIKNDKTDRDPQNEVANEVDEQIDQSAPESLIDERKKAYRARLPFGTVDPAYKNKNLLKDKETRWAPAYFFTNFDLQMGLYYGFRVGFNPGELLDFILGFTTADIYDDDEPYGESMEEQILDNPEFKKLSPDMQKQFMERLKENQSN